MIKFLFLLLFSYQSFSERAYYMEEELFIWTKNKMKEVFNVEYRDDIIFDDIIYLTSWDCLKDEPTQEREGLKATFNNMYQKDKNEIYFHLNNPHEDISLEGEWLISKLVHEYAHFFIKKAGFNEEFDGASKIYDPGLIEGIAYFIQQLWLLEHTGYNMFPDDPDYIKEKLIPNFESMASRLYKMDRPKFMVNVYYYFLENAPEKFYRAMTIPSDFFSLSMVRTKGGLTKKSVLQHFEKLSKNCKN